MNIRQPPSNGRRVTNNLGLELPDPQPAVRRPPTLSAQGAGAPIAAPLNAAPPPNAAPGGPATAVPNATPAQPPGQPVSGQPATGQPVTGQMQPLARPRSPSEKLQPTRPPRVARGRRPKARRRRLHPALRLVSGVLTLSLLLMTAIGILAVAVKNQFEEAGPLREASVVTIPRGRGVNAIAAYLERGGVVSDSRMFVANVYYKGAQSQLKAGKYQIPRGASISDVVDRLIEGRAITHKATFVEGQTSQQIVERLNGLQHLQGTVTLVPPEGSLLPDTYAYTGGMKRAEIIDRMSAAQQQVLERLWLNRQQGLPLQSKDEAVILASIVEKETGNAQERARVAAVFINRLRRGMKLQSDPTIIYGLVGGKGRLGHPIRRSELAKKTAYNTYQIARLPPTPISNPGRASLQATLNPANTDELYFVADGSGGHVFARTLKEHNANVRKWRKIEKSLRLKRQKKGAASRVPVPSVAAAAGLPRFKAGTATAAPQPADAAVNSPKAAGSAAATKLKVISSAIGIAGAAIPLPVRKPKRRRR